MDQPLRDSKILLGVLHLTQVGSNGYTLQAPHAHISGAKIQRKIGVAPDIGGQTPQVLLGCVHNELPSIGGAR